MAADPALLQSIAFFGATALGLGIVAIALLGLWRAMSDGAPLVLFERPAGEGIEAQPDVGDVAARQCTQRSARGPEPQP